MAVTSPNCLLCITEGIEEYERRYLDKELTANQCIENLNVSNWVWRNHINNHVKPQMAIQLANRSELVDHVVDKIGETIKGLDDVKELLDSLKNQVAGSADPNLLKLYLQTLAELRHYVLDLQKLEGDFKESSKVNIQTMNVQFNSLVGHIMQDSCPKCKEKFTTTLRPILDSNSTGSDL